MVYSRLFGKISRHFSYLERINSYGMEDAEYVIIAYGCTARSARAAVRIGRGQGMRVGLLQLLCLWPFARKAVEAALTGKRGRSGA